ncbi:hypothetical protein ACOMHN_008524 [Nucella lapillus]
MSAMAGAISGGGGSAGWTSVSSPHVTGPTVTDPRLSGPTAGGMDPVISKEYYTVAERVIDCGFLTVLGLVGLPANVLNMLVFYRQGLRDKMNLCLFALASVDFLYLLCMFLSTLYCPPAFVSHSLWEQVFKWYTRTYTINFMYAFWYSSGTLTAIIATERCICVVWPLKSATFFSTKSMACMVLGAVVVINLLCLTYALQHVILWDSDDAGNTLVTVGDTAFYHRHKLVFLVVRSTILPTISFLTYFVVSFVTVVTVRKLKTAMDWRQKTSSQVMDKRQVSLVKMLITVSCVYIACNAPKLSLSIVRFVVEEFSTSGRYRNLFVVTHRAGHALLMVNSSVNVLIYFRQSSRFRRELCRLCSCCQRQPDNAQRQVTQ